MRTRTMGPPWRRPAGPDDGHHEPHLPFGHEHGGPGFVLQFARGDGPGGWGGHGPWGGRRGGRRGRRGNVRAAVLALLAESGAQHGYAIMTELTERSGGLWRPSPGSVYPVLAQLQDEGLVVAEESEGRRNFSLTEAGRAHVAEHADELKEPWKVAEAGPRQQIQSLMAGMRALAAAVEQVARHGEQAQTEQAAAVLEDARKRMYRILAGDG